MKRLAMLSVSIILTSIFVFGVLLGFYSISAQADMSSPKTFEQTVLASHESVWQPTQNALLPSDERSNSIPMHAHRSKSFFVRCILAGLMLFIILCALPICVPRKSRTRQNILFCAIAFFFAIINLSSIIPVNARLSYLLKYEARFFLLATAVLYLAEFFASKREKKTLAIICACMIAVSGFSFSNISEALFNSFNILLIIIVFVSFFYTLVRCSIAYVKAISTLNPIIYSTILVVSSIIALISQSMDSLLLGCTIFILLIFYSFLIDNYYIKYRQQQWQAELEQKVAKRTQELELQQRSRDALFASISHDLRTPITVIRGAAEILSEQDLTESSMKCVERILSRSIQLDHLVSDILQLAVIQSQQRPFVFEQVSVPTLMQIIEDEYSSLCAKQNVSLILKPICCNIWVDLRHLIQVFDNLFSNALRYTNNGTIEIGAKLIGEFCQFWVKDSGSGISDEHIPNLFDSFYQAHILQSGFKDNKVQESANVGKNGLGLSICKGIIERMNGEISVTSVVGDGTSFYFTVPIKK